MRIQELRVHRYGPLADVALTNLGDFTLIFGENESGKTLLLDAILRFLLSRKRERDLFLRLDRIEHDPDGFIEVLHEGQNYRFPNQGSLPDLLGINAADLRNVLVVRAGDLQVHGGEDRSYYAEITDRLTGIHREPIKKIKGKLVDIGKLTPSGKLSDAQAYGKVASRVDDASHVLSRIEELNDVLADTDLVALDSELLVAMECKAEAIEDIRLLQEAEKREQYRSGVDLLEDLEKCSKKIADLPAIEQEHYDVWRDAEKIIREKGEDLHQAEKDLAERKEEHKEADATLQSVEESLSELQRRKPAIDDLEKRVDRYRERVEAEASISAVFKLLPRIAGALAILLGIAFIGIIIGVSQSFFTIVAMILGVLLFFIGAALLLDRLSEGRRRMAWESLRLDAAQSGMNVGTFEELLEAMGEFQDELIGAQEKLTGAKTHEGIVASQVEESEKQIKQLEQYIDDAETTLSKLKDDLGLRSFEGLKKVRDDLQKFEKRKTELITNLGVLFGEPNEDEEALEIWRAQIQELALYVEAAPGVIYAKAGQENLKKELEELEEQIGGLEGHLYGIRKEIAEIASEASRILATDEQLPGDAVEDLGTVEKKLRDFVWNIDEKAELARVAIEIFNEIQEEEEQKVKDLFGEDDQASQFFRTITDKAYEQVVYDPNEGELKVIRNDGKALRAYVLSSGTYDQLYLATRLSLAHRILQGEPGFLLFDDPFLTSDSNRLDQQLEILQRLAKEGWQIVYFSVKDEVRDRLQESIDPGDLFVLEDFTLDRSI
jgi:exonuclease SbcC